MSDKYKKPPRLSCIKEQYQAVHERLRYTALGPHKLNAPSMDQLWDIVREMYAMCNDIVTKYDNVPADIAAQFNTDIVQISKTELMHMMKLQQRNIVATQQASSETVTERIIEREITRNNASQSVIEQDTSVTAEKSVSKTEYSKKFKRELTLLLRKMRRHDYHSVQINRVIAIINDWYEKRFCTNYRDRGFELYTYGIGQITQGIYTIIAEYAKSVATNSEHDFFVNLNEWLSTLGYDKHNTEKDVLPKYMHNNFLHPEDIQIYPHTLILWWAIIAPFRSDIDRFYEQYSEAMDPDYIETLAMTDEYDDIYSEAAEMCPNAIVTSNVLSRYNLD